ncbi:MAG: sulfatase [Actinomycetota bacterium]|nr:sulfatase [Actinomycetota bacterium]
MADRWIQIRAVTTLAVLGAVTLMAPSATTTGVARAAPRRPNILIIVTDDQRSSLNLMPETVHRFVENGRLFPQASVTTPLCCPSRSSILTGRFAHNHGVISNTGVTHNLDQTTTLEYYLQRQGYRTAIFGKYLNHWGSENPPYFDDWATAPGNTYYDGTYNVNGTTTTIPAYSTTYLRRKAVRFIDNAATGASREPWFMYLTPFAPHGPFVPQTKYADAVVPPLRDNPAIEEIYKKDKPPYVQEASATYEEGAALHDAQARTLLSVDDMVGRVFAALHDTGQGRNTLAFFLSDNGFMWGEHGLVKKSVPYLQSIKVPMMMRWPNHGVDGTSDFRLVANIDIAPTVLDATGYAGTLNAPLDGRSLLDPSWWRGRMLNEFWSVEQRTPTWASTRTRKYQYTEYYDADGNIIFREYYDLVHDPWQLDNLLGDSDPTNDPTNLEALHDQLSADRSCEGTTGPAACP